MQTILVSAANATSIPTVMSFHIDTRFSILSHILGKLIYQYESKRKTSPLTVTCDSTYKTTSPSQYKILQSTLSPKSNPHRHQSTISTATKVQSPRLPKYNLRRHQSTIYDATKVQSTTPPKYNLRRHQSTIYDATKVQSTPPPKCNPHGYHYIKYNPHCHQSTIHTSTREQSTLPPKYNPYFHQSRPTIHSATKV